MSEEVIDGQDPFDGRTVFNKSAEGDVPRKGDGSSDLRLPGNFVGAGCTDEQMANAKKILETNQKLREEALKLREEANDLPEAQRERVLTYAEGIISQLGKTDLSLEEPDARKGLPAWLIHNP